MRYPIQLWRVGIAVGAIAVGCSSPMNPTTQQGDALPKSSASSVGASASDDGTASPWPTWQVGGATGEFRFRPDPPEGPAPLTVEVNMCHSTDPSPGISLHYHVTWGDGDDDRGFCRFQHVYPGDGTFTTIACVSDEIAAQRPGVCHTTVVTVSGTAGGGNDQRKQTLVGSFPIGNGPVWTTNPPVYSCVQACA